MTRRREQRRTVRVHEASARLGAAIIAVRSHSAGCHIASMTSTVIMRRIPLESTRSASLP